MIMILIMIIFYFINSWQQNRIGWNPHTLLNFENVTNNQISNWYFLFLTIIIKNTNFIVVLLLSMYPADIDLTVPRQSRF